MVSFEQPGPETKIADFANSIDPDELAHNKLPQVKMHLVSTVFIRL